MPTALGWGVLAAAGMAASILIWFLRTRPVLDLQARLWLFAGLAVLPTAAAGAEIVNGLEQTTSRDFCGSCHVMELHVADAEDPQSDSLAARHTRNPWFGGKNCYTCHADYSLLGYPLTKLNGLEHVYHYYTGGYLGQTVEEGVERIHLYKPYPNKNCRQCHSGELQSFRNVREHLALESALRAEQVSCVGSGCHGFAHTFNKQGKLLDGVAHAGAAK